MFIEVVRTEPITPPGRISTTDRVRSLIENTTSGDEFYFEDKGVLQLMSLLNDVSRIPTSGKNLIIVAAVNNVLHFRIFDGDGKVVVDTGEKSLAEQARQIEDLREQLESLWPPHELTRSEKSRVITAVTSIGGYTRPIFHLHRSEEKEAIEEGRLGPLLDEQHYRREEALKRFAPLWLVLRSTPRWQLGEIYTGLDGRDLARYPWDRRATRLWKRKVDSRQRSSICSFSITS